MSEEEAGRPREDKPPPSSFDFIGLFAGLAAGELANILQGHISYYIGISREFLSMTALAFYIAVIINLVLASQKVGRATEARDKVKEN